MHDRTAESEPADTESADQAERALLEGLGSELGELQLCERQLTLGQGPEAVHLDLVLRDAAGRLWLVAQVDGSARGSAVCALELFALARRERALLTHIAGASEASNVHVALVAPHFEPQALDWLAAFSTSPLALFEWRTISSPKRTLRLLVALSAAHGEPLLPPTLDEFQEGLGESERELVLRLAQLDPELELGVGRAELRFELEGAPLCRLQKHGERLSGAIAGGENRELLGPEAARDFLDRVLAELAPRVGASGRAHAALEAALGNDPSRPILSNEELAAFRD